jgi:hypothetical protein
MKDSKHIAKFLALFMGFSLSFVIVFLTLLLPFDLFLGDVLREAPINLARHNQALADATIALGTFWFWAAVSALGVFFSWWLLKGLRG